MLHLTSFYFSVFVERSKSNETQKKGFIREKYTVFFIYLDKENTQSKLLTNKSNINRLSAHWSFRHKIQSHILNSLFFLGDTYNDIFIFKDPEIPKLTLLKEVIFIKFS